MGLQVPHAVSRHLRVYAVAEGTPGTYARATAASALRARSLDLSGGRERVAQADAQDGLDPYDMVTGRHSANWSLVANIRPSGSAGTAPDIGPVLLAALGTETVAGGTSVTYGLTNSQTAASRSLSITGAYPDGTDDGPLTAMRAVLGALVAELQIVINGSDLPQITASGPARRYVPTGYSTISSGATSATQAVAAAAMFNVDSVVSIDTDDNSGTGYRVTAISGSNLTLEASVATTTADVIRPYAPLPTLAGSILSQIVATVTIGGQTYSVQSATLRVANNWSLAADEAGEDEAFSDATVGRRKIRLEVQLRARRDWMVLHNNPSFATQAITVAVGSTAGAIMTISLPQAERVIYGAIADQADAESTMTIAWVARASAEGALDALTVAFT